MSTTLLVVSPKGATYCLYDEALPWSALGQVTIQRASHVEPDCQGQWHADLAPIGGPRLGPFPLRSQALAAERQWLIEHWLDSAVRPVS
jgi:hypothetical protein